MMLITILMVCVIIPKTLFEQLRLTLEHRVLVVVLPILENLTITFDSNMPHACFVKRGDVTYGFSTPLLSHC